MAAGEEAILEFGDHAIRLGGCPLSEHGVGQSPVKQALLRRLYGAPGIAEMRRGQGGPRPGVEARAGRAVREGRSGIERGYLFDTWLAPRNIVNARPFSAAPSSPDKSVKMT